MRKLILLLLVVMLLGLGAVPVSAGGASTYRVADVPSVVGVNPQTFALMMCDFVERVVKPDGTARETQECTLTGVFLDMNGVECTGQPGCGLPDRAYKLTGGECEWYSDYWYTVYGEYLIADSYSFVVTPSGKAHIVTTYPATPITYCYPS